MPCPQCNDSADNHNCLRCDGTGRVCDLCGEASCDIGSDLCSACQRELDGEEEI